MKLGVFGGSFDPIHFGHLILAEIACETAGLGKVLFVPATQSPLKSVEPRAKKRQRVEMLQLALAGNDRFEMSSIELDRDGVSYTVDTLNQIREQYPDDELFLIVGSDSAASFDRWKNIGEICQLAIPLIGSRRGSSADLDQLKEFVTVERLQEIKQFAFEFPWIEISSTELRQRMADDRSIRYRLPRAVECYMQTAKLYR